jgi:hypothetical protein
MSKLKEITREGKKRKLVETLVLLASTQSARAE